MPKGAKFGGRKKGTPNKMSLSIKEAVLETFQNLGGVAHMTTWAQDNPSDFYRIAAKLIPQHISADVKHIHDVSDLSDSELSNIATGRSQGAATQAESQGKVH